ncbi:uncharacterized protein LOC101860601 [Aplysia californica]|uniref:Uncharacterized protein LOC101860601 n=1 Tax=Aplysia californica TaxID=6500 RepID=A0ABM1W0F9_APLCA|nr:uncharacterized protein LOC101860601 [Aplysia californica]
MDVEGYELESLLAALNDGSLDDVRQLNFESHVSWGNTDPTKAEYIKFLGLLRKVYEKGFRIYLTHRNYMYSSFLSRLTAGKKRVKCHEVHTVNINHINPGWREKQQQQQLTWRRETALNQQQQHLGWTNSCWIFKSPARGDDNIECFNLVAPLTTSL